jgi:hypothetical protein
MPSASHFHAGNADRIDNKQTFAHDVEDEYS